jgi:hypothetical protein
MGAAVATTAALLLQIVLNQIGLVRLTEVRLFHRKHSVPYVAAAVGFGLLLAVQQIWHPPLPVGVVLTAIVSIAVVYFSRRSLEIISAIPELTRIPLLGRVFG